MRNGNFPKVRWNFYKERFRTKEGLFDFFVGTAFWGFLIIEFNSVVLTFLTDLFSIISIPLISRYLSYLAFGLIASFLHIFLGMAVNYIYEVIRRWVN